MKVYLTHNEKTAVLVDMIHKLDGMGTIGRAAAFDLVVVYAKEHDDWPKEEMRYEFDKVPPPPAPQHRVLPDVQAAVDKVITEHGGVVAVLPEPNEDDERPF